MWKIIVILTGLIGPCFGGGIPGTGQSGLLSYTDNGNGTITDNKTGLMWIKDGNSAGANNGATLTWEQALSLCEGLNYAGFTDWRLPNIRELFSIVDFGRSPIEIDDNYFTNTKSDNLGLYWSSTTNVLDTTVAWCVTFNYGLTSSGGTKTSSTSVHVRCVRGGP